MLDDHYRRNLNDCCLFDSFWCSSCKTQEDPMAWKIIHLLHELWWKLVKNSAYLVGGFLFWWNSKLANVHAPKMSQFFHRFQNCFCFCSRTFPSYVGTFFCFNGNYNGKTAKNLFTAIKSSRSVLQPSSHHCWATSEQLSCWTPTLIPPLVPWDSGSQGAPENLGTQNKKECI